MNSEEIEILSTEEAAQRLGVAEQTLRGWRHRGCGPRYIKVGGRLVRYRLSDLQDWLEEQTHVPGSHAST